MAQRSQNVDGARAGSSNGSAGVRDPFANCEEAELLTKASSEISYEGVIPDYAYREAETVVRFAGRGPRGHRMVFFASIPGRTQTTELRGGDMGRQVLGYHGLAHEFAPLSVDVYHVKVALMKVESQQSGNVISEQDLTDFSFEVEFKANNSEGHKPLAKVRSKKLDECVIDGKKSANALSIYLDSRHFMDAVAMQHESGRTFAYILEIKNITKKAKPWWPLREGTSSSLAKDMAVAFSSEDIMGGTSDFRIELPNGEAMDAHKLVLSARSEVFRAMLEHDTMEKRNNRMIIKDVDPAILKIFLEYLYTDRLPERHGFDILVPMLEIAVKYQVSSLIDLLSQTMLGHLTPGNAAHLLTVATMFSVDSLADSVLDFVSNHVEEVMETKDFDQLLEDYPSLAKKIMRKMAPKTR